MTITERFVIPALFTATAAVAQSAPPPETIPELAPVATYPRPTEFPNEDRKSATEHYRKALKLAGPDLFVDMAHRCILDARYKPRINGEQYFGLADPFAAFDSLYSVGQIAVSSWALKTSAGIVLFDALYTEAQARDIIVPNLERVGLDPKNVKYLVVTHSHRDHYGGAAYFQKTYGTRIISSDLDWNEMEHPAQSRPARGSTVPQRDIVVVDGQTMTFGNTPITFYITPGHTVGTLSTIFPVTDRGARHVVGFYGGLGMPLTTEMKRAQINSIERWMTITRKAGVDAQIANHPLQDEGLERAETLRYRAPGDPNPFVLGRATYQRFMGVQAECVRLGLARDGIAN